MFKSLKKIESRGQEISRSANCLCLQIIFSPSKLKRNEISSDFFSFQQPIVVTKSLYHFQTEIAIVTADFVKIYDLGKDVLSPQYYFLVPSGKIRDCTLAFTEEGKFVVLMSSAGHIYFQGLTEDSSAVNGPFYVTNIMTVTDDSIKDGTSEQVCIIFFDFTY
jgi:hypothetical protein